MKEAASNFVPPGFTSATCILQQRATLLKISSGSKELDAILEGARLCHRY